MGKAVKGFHMKSEDIVKLVIEPSGLCNAKCPHCPRYTDDGFLLNYIPETHLLPNISKNISASKLKNLKLVEMNGSTGDPFMNPYIEEIVKIFEFVPVISIDTNGGLRGKNWWKNFAKFKNVAVTWSIDGLEDTNHLYRVGVDYNKVIENAKSFIDEGGFAVWKFIIFKHNQHQIEEATHLAKEMGFKKIKIIKAYDYRFQNIKEWPVLIKGKFSHVISPSDYPTNYLREINFDLVDNINFNPIKQNNKFCTWLKNGSMFINVLGELLPCCMATHETTNDYPGKVEFMKLIDNDVKNISLYHNSIDDILEKYYGNTFDNTFQNFNTMLPLCQKSCPGAPQGSNSITGMRVPTTSANKKI
jgi:MoaA/NifB/PqqE/SkfB family radical SAM enzyme